MFQSALGPQQAKMDVTIKSGKVLIERGEVDDAVIVEAKIAELKERWDGLCGLSVERYVFNNCANKLSRYPHILSKKLNNSNVIVIFLCRCG